jgi:hypothetical protein
MAMARINWGAALVSAIGLAAVLLGARGFYLRGQFGFTDALYCALLLIPAALLLLVTSYVLQHGKFAAVIPVAFAGLLARAYPSFAVAIGLAVIGAVAGPALTKK